jgi:N-acetylglutamate synthase-like GNAT family acetyltransferase
MDMRKAAAEDYGRLVALAGKEGWNYSIEDFLELERTGCATTLVADLDGALRGMVTIMDYGGMGWISNMLVEGGYRMKHMGAELLQEGMKRLAAKRTIALFSYGEAVGYYLKQGFRLERDYPVVRYVGGRVGSRGGREPSIGEIEAMDSRAFSGKRGGLLGALARKGKVFSPARGEGFAIVRPHPVEPSVGPVVCGDAGAGRDLLYSAFDYLGAGAMGVLVGGTVEGFEVSGRVSRLYVGEPPQTDNGVALAFAGLEFG